MKLLASIIIAVSLVIGVVGAMTAYLPPLSLPAEELVGLELNAPAGRDPDDPTKPLARGGDTITPELLAQLRDQNITRIKVKEFSLGRWTGWPLFVIGGIGLAGGAVMLRHFGRRAVLIQTGPIAEAAAARRGPEASFEAIRSGIGELRRRLPSLPPREKLLAILDTFGEVQRTHIPAFIAARPELTARLGLAGYAQLMDSFAAAERQLNRAWSAAADGVLDEALERVETSALLFDEAAAKLR